MRVKTVIAATLALGLFSAEAAAERASDERRELLVSSNHFFSLA